MIRILCNIVCKISSVYWPLNDYTHINEWLPWLEHKHSNKFTAFRVTREFMAHSICLCILLMKIRHDNAKTFLCSDIIVKTQFIQSFSMTVFNVFNLYKKKYFKNSFLKFFVWNISDFSSYCLFSHFHLTDFQTFL